VAERFLKDPITEATACISSACLIWQEHVYLLSMRCIWVDVSWNRAGAVGGVDRVRGSPGAKPSPSVMHRPWWFFRCVADL